MFEWLGAAVVRRRRAILAASACFLLLAVALLVRGGTLTAGHIRGLEADRAQEAAAEVLGHPLDTTFVAVLRSAEHEPGDAAFRSAMRALLDPLASDPHVASVVTPDNAPAILAPGLENDDARAALALVTLKGDLKEALQAYPAVRARLRSERLSVTCTGQVPFLVDLQRTLEADLLRAELVSLPLALLVLLLVFRTAVAAILPVAVGALAVTGGISLVIAISRHADVAAYTINVCSLIGLGVAIDYSLFTVSRYREELAGGADGDEALRRAVATAGRVVAFSAVAVASGLAGLLFFEGSYLLAMGLGGALVVFLAALFALTTLPALLSVLGPRIHAGRILPERETRQGGAWHRLALGVMRHPLRILVPTIAVLLWMGVPFLHLRLAAADVRVLDREVEARQGFELLRAHFPDQARTRVLLAVRFPDAPALTRERIGALFDLASRVARIPGVTKVESIVSGAEAQGFGREEYQSMILDPPPLAAPAVEAAKKMTVGERTVLLWASTDEPSDGEAARGIVRAIRAERAVGDGTLLAGGETANDLDTTGFILRRTPRAIALVVGVTLLTLFVLLGSVVLPLKAVAMNFLSIAGSFGALVWVFQDGHLWVREPRGLEPSLPVLLFCLLFGLSMDYEVLMLSRMKESWGQKRDNTAAVAEGLERTAGLVTSAAAIMVAVFGAFTLAKVVLIQSVGFGMALAVALDATLVRVLLVPSTMRLFGDLNWWLPRPLTRLRRFLGAAHEGE